MQQPGEPSVEEILDSIKKVIARDAAEGSMEERRRSARAPVHGVEPVAADEAAEVLELGEEEIFVDLPAPSITIDDEPARAIPLRSEDKEKHAINSDDSESGEAERDSEIAAQEQAAIDNDPLTSAIVRDNLRANFSALTRAHGGNGSGMARGSETSIEGLVRELLRPMLAQWLDDNLPSIVEAMVQAEIARISRNG